VRLVVERGEAMQSAGDGRRGTMAAVLGLDDDKVEQACIETPGDVWVANYNAPGQVVIAGDPDALRAAGAVAKGLGAKKVVALPVSGAFHTPFMASAQDRLVKAISTVELRAPDFPVVANVDAHAHADAADWAELLGAQLCNPVRWRQSLYTLDEMGVTTFVELGTGSVLSGMTKRTIIGATAVSVSTPDELDIFLDLLHGTVVEPTGTHEGEHLFATERVVVSPSAGVFDPDPSLSAGLVLVPGQVLGRVGDEEVRSPFTGSIVGVLAVPGERVTISQPIAWLRTA
jgi:[acyl-carrier-protein] S-malonyltransferase